MHVRFLQVEGEKMAKRSGNFYTVRDLVDEGFDPLALRYALIQVPYGKPLNFTMQSLCDNLNTSVALAKALEGARVINRGDLDRKGALAGRWFLEKINALLGVVCNDYGTCEEGPASAEEPAVEGKSVSEWIEERDTAKQSRDFGAADAIRNKLAAAGIELRDSPEGTTWVKKPVGV
jgi:cysteinyl-tRNA synthetase